jgi:hypothetical protein
MSITTKVQSKVFLLLLMLAFSISNAQVKYVSPPQERLYIHTDKEVYLAGEIVWFKLYCVDAINQHPVFWSKVAYVELIGNNLKPVWQGKVSLKAEDKEGSYHLPLSLNSGKYVLRAYTNFMKNQGADHFFQKEITIINTLKDNPVIISDTSLHYSVQFFPEGGKLINGASTTMGFKIMDSYGRGVNGRGFILTGPSDTLLSFISLKFGMGHFNMTPFSEVRYRAIVFLENGSFITAELPKIYDHGYVMNIHNLQDHYEVDVKVNMGSESEEQELFLLTHAADGHETKSVLQIKNAAAHASISKTALGTGIITCTLLDMETKPLCERLLFNRWEQKEILPISTDKQEYAQRAPVQLIGNGSDNSTSGDDLSISVWKIDSLSPASECTIVNYFLFSSALKGNIDSIDYYFGNNNPDIQEATENLLLTQGWRMFKDVDKHQKPLLYSYPLEYNAQIVQLKVTDSRTGLPAENIQTFLSVPGTNFRFYSVSTDKKGIANFELPDLYGYNEIIVQTNTQEDSFYHVELMSPYSLEPIYKLTPFVFEKNRLTDLQKENIDMQAQNIYHGERLRNFGLPEIADTLPFYGYPSKSYDLDNYTRFTTMEEVFREYVREINVGVRGGQFVFKMLNENQREYGTEDILVLLDGIPVLDHRKIFNYDPLKVKRLDVIPQNYILGPSTFSGIASFITYEGNYKGFDLDPRMVSFDYEGLQLRREFYSPVYYTEALKNSRLPDFRTTLYWSPHFKLTGNKPYSFYTSDVKGKFMVLVQGISAAGNLIYSTSSFEVK